MKKNKNKVRLKARTTRKPDVQLAFNGKKALRPIADFSTFSEIIEQFGYFFNPIQAGEGGGGFRPLPPSIFL